MKTIIINQCTKLGDILFSLQYAQELNNRGHNIIYPVKQHILEISEYCPKVHIVPMKDIDINYNSQKLIENAKYIVVPLRYSTSLVKNYTTERGLSAKYELLTSYFNLKSTLNDWNKPKIIINESKSKKLFNNLELKSKQYNLINENFAWTLQRKIEVNNGLANIYMKTIPKYSIFDWWDVIKNADSVHTVSTALVIFIEIMGSMIETKLIPKLYLYPRTINGFLNNIDWLLKLPWNKIETGIKKPKEKR